MCIAKELDSVDKVVVITASKHLSNRDFEDYEQYFTLYGKTGLISYDNNIPSALNPKIIYFSTKPIISSVSTQLLCAPSPTRAK